MKNKKILVLPLIMTCSLLAGCASQSKRVVDLHLQYMTTNSAPVASYDAEAQQQLAQAATSVDQSLSQLSAIKLATHPHVKLGSPTNANAIGMGQITSINWTGPVEPLLRRLASTSHYRLNVIGSKPPVPVIATLNVRNQTIAAIIRNVKYQAAGKANIYVYPRKRIVELRYKA